ncbi:hypothetical protein FKW77_009484 [Venturia effusa]|uniref:Uncharacterized protein n=1 Tax=Venturia effusa TaxID=50376 RepID=A0A517KXB2_9PEZI|nr:hypothetical protein FKW77_009484 [Venturia effusa]
MEGLDASNASRADADLDVDGAGLALSFDFSEVDVEAQPQPRPHTSRSHLHPLPLPPPPRTHTARNKTRIRELQEQLRELQDSPEAAHVTSNIPLSLSHPHPHPIQGQGQRQRYQKPLPRTPSPSPPHPPSGQTVPDSEGEITLVPSPNSRTLHPENDGRGRHGNTPTLPSPIPRHPRDPGSPISPSQQRRGRLDPNSRDGPINRAEPWRYNDSDNDSDSKTETSTTLGEAGLFTLFACRAREFEADE